MDNLILATALRFGSAVIEVERGNITEEAAAKLLRATDFREYDVNTVISFIREARIK